MSIKISICIPIYNCAEFVEQALDSILNQIDDRTEVIIYDGGSKDKTSDLMPAYIKLWPSFQYHRSNIRGGIDADMEICASFAQGEYIWFFSGDDVMRPGAIERALNWIETGDDVYLCEHSICDRNMKFLKPYPMFIFNKPVCLDMSNLPSRLAWFRKALTTEPFFSFMSSLLVRREKWQSGRLAEEFNGSCWGHVARLFELMPSGLTVYYVAEVWLDKRGDNDSFADKGVVNRYRIAIEGYRKISDTYLGHSSEEAFHIRRVIRNEFSLPMFMYAKWLCKLDPTQESKVLLDKLVRITYCDDSKKETFFLLVYKSPVWMISIIEVIYKKCLLVLHWLRRCAR